MTLPSDELPSLLVTPRQTEYLARLGGGAKATLRGLKSRSGCSGVGHPLGTCQPSRHGRVLQGFWAGRGLSLPCPDTNSPLAAAYRSLRRTVAISSGGLQQSSSVLSVTENDFQGGNAPCSKSDLFVARLRQGQLKSEESSRLGMNPRRYAESLSVLDSDFRPSRLTAPCSQDAAEQTLDAFWSFSCHGLRGCSPG